MTNTNDERGPNDRRPNKLRNDKREHDISRASSRSVGPSAATTGALLAALLAACAPLGAPTPAYAGIDPVEHRALLRAVERVADSVVQIQAIGGIDQIEGEQTAAGPTTGLVVSADGYIVASAFGFAQRPSSIVARLADGSRRAAKLVGRDSNRMLVLLKVDAPTPLPVPEAAPLAEVRAGYAVAAVGRTYREDVTNVALGVVSQLGRMHNRVLQTDASTSIANYGGPLVDLQGRVLGIIVPMSPQASAPGEVNEMAGAEFYDSGIGFAAPLEHVFAVLPRWIEERELRRGLLGIGMASGSPHATPALVTSIWPGSPAAEAGWKPGDRIVEIEGIKIASQTQLRFQVVPRYAGDVLHVTLERAGDADAPPDALTPNRPPGESNSSSVERIETRVELATELAPYRHAFLGVLPALPPKGADDAQATAPATSSASGILVRETWPMSPAAEAGIVAGDRITHLDDDEVGDVTTAIGILRARNVGERIALRMVRDQQTRNVECKLAAMPGQPLPTGVAAVGGSDAADGAGTSGGAWETGAIQLPDLPLTAQYFKPAKSAGPVGLLVWLGGENKERREELAEALRGPLQAAQFGLLMPSPTDKGPDPVWTRDDFVALGRLLPEALRTMNVDARRVAVGGQRRGGQAAYQFGFQARRLVSGIVSIAAPLPRTLNVPENVPGSRIQILAIAEKDSPFSLLVRNDVSILAAAGYPATWIEAPAQVEGVVLHRSAAALLTTIQWLNSLDAL